MSSVRAVEDAIGVQIPKNARLIRNLLHGAQYQHDHIVHFYHLHALDWVDIVSALKADPKKTAALADNVSNARWAVPPTTSRSSSGSRPSWTAAAGPLRQCLLGPPGLQAAAGSQPDGLCALHRSPAASGPGRPHARHLRRQEPPSPVPGGGRHHLQCSGHDPDRIAEFLYITKETQEFIKNVYIPDLLAVASFYKDWGGIGGTTNFLAYGDFP
jgi:[NiFe] hydrogenase large subunit